MVARPRVLLVGPPDDLTSLAGALRDAGDEVSTEAEVLAVPSAIGSFRPDVIVVAVPPDAADDVTVTCRRAHGLGDVPVIALPDVHDPCFCQAVLSAGADDCVAATDPVELVLTHVRSVLARRGRVAAPAMEIGDLIVDEAAHTVSRGGEPVTLTPLEFSLLVELARHPGVVVRKADLLNHLWTRFATRNSVDQAVSRLRRKLAGACAVRTVRGIGYVLCPADVIA